MGTIIEFAIVLFLQRKQDFHQEINPEKIEKTKKKNMGLPGSTRFSVNIDAKSFVLFFMMMAGGSFGSIDAQEERF